MRLSFSAIAALGLLANVTWAQTPPQACQTGGDVPGQAFEGFYGSITAPTPFERVESDRPGTSVIPAIPVGDARLMITENRGPALLTFFNADAPVHRCTLDVVPFDPARHTFTAIGDCSWTTDPNVPVLTGIARYLKAPRGFLEVSVGNPEILDLTPISNQLVYLFGRSRGISDIIMIDADEQIIAHCPFVIEDASAFFAKHEFDEDLLCRNAQNQPARLSMGETFHVTFATPFVEAAVAAPEIASMRVLSGTEYRVTGQAPGMTNVMSLGQRGALHHDCFVVVE